MLIQVLCYLLFLKNIVSYRYVMICFVIIVLYDRKIEKAFLQNNVNSLLIY